MKVYTSLVIDIETGRTLEEESFEYRGPIAECEPISMSITAMTGLSAVAQSWIGLGMSAISTLVGGIQQSGALGAQAANADAEAKQALKEGREAVRRRREEAEELTSSQIATLGASGIDIMGSPLDVIIKDRARGELHAQDALYSAKITAANKSYEAKLARYQQSGVVPGALLSIGGKVLSSGTTLLGGQKFGAT